MEWGQEGGGSGSARGQKPKVKLVARVRRKRRTLCVVKGDQVTVQLRATGLPHRGGSRPVSPPCRVEPLAHVQSQGLLEYLKQAETPSWWSRHLAHTTVHRWHSNHRSAPCDHALGRSANSGTNAQHAITRARERARSAQTHARSEEHIRAHSTRRLANSLLDHVPDAAKSFAILAGKAAQPRSSEKHAASRAGQTPCARWAVGICYTRAKSVCNG